MKFLNLIYGLSQIANPVLTNKQENIFLNTNTKVFSKDVSINDIQRQGNRMVIQSDNTKNYLLNKEQGDLLNDVHVKNIDIQIDYEATFITDFIRTSVQYNHHYNDLLSIKDDNKVTKFMNDTDKEISIQTGSVNNKIEHKNKDGNTALSLNPYISIAGDDFEKDKNNPKGFYELKIKSILLSGDKEFYDLSNIVMKPIDIEYGYTVGNRSVESWLKSKRLETFLNKEYGLPMDFVDKEKTRQNFVYDSLNHTKENSYYITIVPNNKYASYGTLEQELVFRKNPSDFSDMDTIDDIYSNNLKSIFDQYYIDGKLIQIEINMDEEDIRFLTNKQKCDWYFHNNGPLENGLYLKIVKDHKDAAYLKGDTVEILDGFNREDFGGMLDNYKTVNDAELEDKSEEEIKDNNESKDESLPTDKDEVKDEDANNNDSSKDEEVNDNGSSNEIIDKDEEIDEGDGMLINDKSNPYKYLWLLVIPVVLGIGAMLTYFIRFKKRKTK